MGGIIIENKEFAKRLSDKLTELITAELEKENAKSDTRPITERVQTFEDACNILGPEHSLVKSWLRFGCDSGSRDYNLEAYLKLRIICAALNEGWEPNYTRDELKYSPWFLLFTDEEVANMDNDEVVDRRLLVIADRYKTEYVGFGFSPRRTPTTAGCSLCLKSAELSAYCGRNFIGIWADYLLIRK